MHVVKSFTTSVKGREIPPVIHLKQLDEHTHVEHEQETDRRERECFDIFTYKHTVYFSLLFVVSFFFFFVCDPIGHNVI